MEVKEYIDILRPIVLDLFKNDSSGHDISHLERTMKTALYLQEKEGGDRVIIGISAFLHDVHRILQNEEGKFVSPKDSLEIIRRILNNIELTNNQIEEICYCIEHHENYNWNGENIDNLNALIIQDADNLDAIGAIGIGRTFSYGGAHGVLMYDENTSLTDFDNYKEENGDDPSTIHHFYHKLFRLGENMNTKSAKELAKKKIDFMKLFVEEFLNEWNANY